MSRWQAAVLCVAGWIALAWGLNFFFGSLMAARTPGRPAYAPEGAPPPVDLAAVQRGWPNSLAAPGERVRMAAYMQGMERQAPSLVPARGAAWPRLVARRRGSVRRGGLTVGRSRFEIERLIVGEQRR